MNGPQSFEFGNAQVLDASALQNAMTRDGAFVVRNLLSVSEIARLREQVRQRLVRSGRRLSLGRTLPGAASASELSWALSHPRIVAVFKALSGSTSTLFTGHCDIHMNMLSGWHKDSGETYGGYFTGDYFAADDCCVYKAAIYLQDAGERDGLTIRCGSHRTPDLNAGTDAKLLTRRGDVVFFDVRINHCGQLPDLVETGIKAAAKVATRGSRIAQEPPWASRVRDLYWRVTGRDDRLSVFFTYGASNRYTEEFAEANVRRQLQQAGADEALLPAGLLESLREQDVRLCAAAGAAQG